MLSNMNILMVGRNDWLRDKIEGLGAEVCVATSYENALAALRVYSLHCAIILGGVTAFESETLRAMLDTAEFPYVRVDGVYNDTSSTTNADTELVGWLLAIWSDHQPHEFEWSWQSGEALVKS